SRRSSWVGPSGRTPRAVDGASRPAGDAPGIGLPARYPEKVCRSCVGTTMNKRIVVAVAALASCAFATSLMAQGQPAPSPLPSPLPTQPQPPKDQPARTAAYPMPEVVVTATGRPEPLAKVAGTVQVIDQDRISKSTAKSITELFAENAVGFMSE